VINGNISIEEFKRSVGIELGPSDWLLVDQTRIDQFADATNDHQFIHVDPEKAAETPFGSTIAHGFLSLSLVSHLVGQIMLVPKGTTMGINYGLDKVRFLQPVKVNARLRARARIEKVSKRPRGQYLVKSGVTIDIENEHRPALVAELLSIYVLDDQST
jgi:acyl dehydratase